jgi:hypothetical protein
MKPLNLDNKPCSPISSNCVIWQGPNIPCINLCTGDTVSDVVGKLATELCAVLDTLNVTNYDLSCFNLVACGPNDFQALIQFLIEQICALQNQTPGTTTDTTKSDTLVTVADCFVINGVTIMTVAEYAMAIGNKVCSLVSQISAINQAITNLDIRVSELEAAPVPTLVLPSFTLGCTIGSLGVGSTQFIDAVLEQFINDVWCPFYAATGTTSDLISAVSAICITDSDLQLSTETAFSTNSNWIQAGSYSTIADAINNLWVALCDVYQYSSLLKVTSNDTSTIDLTVSSGPGYVITANITDTGWVDLNGFAYYSGVTKPQCRRIGNQIHFRGTVYVPLSNPASPGNVVVLSSASAYNGIAGCTTWSGTGGCTIDGNGAILFNNGGSVIPSSVTTGTLDGQYSLGWIVATRGIDVDGTYGTSLSSAMNVFITSTNGLTVQLVHDVEITTTRGAGVQGNSPLRLITSNVRLGEYLPNYIATATDIHNAPSNANFPLVSSTFNLTWPFSCDAGNENQIGGFQFKLDGLVGYLDPCNTETGFSATC